MILLIFGSTSDPERKQTSYISVFWGEDGRLLWAGFQGMTPVLTAQYFGAATAINLQNEGMVRAAQRQNAGELAAPLRSRETLICTAEVCVYICSAPNCLGCKCLLCLNGSLSKTKSERGVSHFFCSGLDGESRLKTNVFIRSKGEINIISQKQDILLKLLTLYHWH